MAALKEKADTLLGSATISLATGAAVTLFTTPVGKVTRITHAVIRDYATSIAAATSVTILGLGAAFSCGNGTTGNTGFLVVRPTNLTEQLEIAEKTVVTLTPTVGASVTVTVDVFGYLT